MPNLPLKVTSYPGGSMLKTSILISLDFKKENFKTFQFGDGLS